MTVKEAKEKYYDHFFGNAISDYGMENGYIDYACLSHAGDCVLCNNIVNRYEYLELESGTDYDEETNEPIEFYQYYIIDDNLAKIIKDFAPDETLWYDIELDVYVWGIAHYGTSWDYVLTDIPLREKY